LNYQKSDGELLAEIAAKLDTLIALVAARSAGEDPANIIERLHAMKLSPKVISLASGISENAVNVRISRMKKKKASARAVGVAP